MARHFVDRLFTFGSILIVQQDHVKCGVPVIVLKPPKTLEKGLKTKIRCIFLQLSYFSTFFQKFERPVGEFSQQL